MESKVVEEMANFQTVGNFRLSDGNFYNILKYLNVNFMSAEQTEEWPKG